MSEEIKPAIDRQIDTRGGQLDIIVDHPLLQSLSQERRDYVATLYTDLTYILLTAIASEQDIQAAGKQLEDVFFDLALRMEDARLGLFGLEAMLVHGRANRDWKTVLENRNSNRSIN